MRLEDFLERFVDEYQDFQILNGRTGEYLTSVDYYADDLVIDNIDLYGDCFVLGIGTQTRTVREQEEPFLVISIDAKRKIK